MVAISIRNSVTIRPVFEEHRRAMYSGEHVVVLAYALIALKKKFMTSFIIQTSVLVSFVNSKFLP